MLVIRAAQITAFEEHLRRDDPRRVARYLRKALPDRVADLDDDALLARVRADMARAARHGLHVEWDLCRFSRFELLFGPVFEERCDWARDIFEDEGSGTEKMDAIERHHANYPT